MSFSGGKTTLSRVGGKMMTCRSRKQSSGSQPVQYTLARKADTFIPISSLFLIHRTFSSSTHQVNYRGKNEEREQQQKLV